jgi:PAS domain S-box-containing protein
VESNAVRIAESAIENADVEGLDEPMRAVVLQLAQRIPSETPVETATLRDHGADPVTITRLLRGVEAESIEVLRETHDGSDFRETVLALRKCIRKSLPVVPLNPDGITLYQGLVGADTVEFRAENRRLYGLFKGILRSIRDLVYVHDMRGYLLYVNDRGLEMTKYTREDLLAGMSVMDFVVPQYLDIVEERMSAPPGKLSPYSIEIYTKEGDRIPIEIDTRVLFNDEGRPDAVVGVAKDLRLEHRLQKDIARINRSFDRLLEELPLAVILCDARGVVQEINQYAVTLCGNPPPTALIGHHLLTLCAHDSHDVKALLETALSGHRRIQQTVTLRTRFGADLHQCVLTISPLESEGRAFAGLLVLITDAQ